MILTGPEIWKRMKTGQIKIEPFNDSQINPNSYNLTIHPEIKTYDLFTEVDGKTKFHELDVRRKPKEVVYTIPEEGFILYPGTLYIARTNEYTETHGLVPMLNGRSSLGRLGLFVEICAGFGDTGFKGTWTLELAVVHPLRIYPNMKICQIYYMEPIGELTEYAGKYQGQIEATASRLFTETV